MLAHSLQQLAFPWALQRRGLMQGNQQGTQLQAAQVLDGTVHFSIKGQAGLSLAEVDDWAVAFFVLIPGQQARQFGQWRERTEQHVALALGEVERIAQGQYQHLLIEAAQRTGRRGLEGGGDVLVQAALVFADPVQQVAVAP